MKITICDRPAVRVAIIDHINSKWTHPIAQAYQAALESTHEDLQFRFFIFNCGKEILLKDILKWNPDIVFMPDEVIYRAFARDIATQSEAHVSVFFSAMLKKDILNLKNQSGVYNKYPSDKILEIARKIVPVESIGVISGPLGIEAVALIEEPISDQVRIEAFVEYTWDKYQERLASMESKYDVVWLLLPFGVLDGDSWVDFDKLKPILNTYKIPTLGFGSIDSVHRTITVGLLPEKVGQYCAALTYRAFFKGQDSVIKDYQSYELSIDSAQISRLGLKVPDEMTHFIREVL
ncbi:MAG: hypothetical protein H6618_05360 [Deltaproteobacteria bacterium]|nr:hypothetical protein [Deltaproteobacteria bacterium]